MLTKAEQLNENVDRAEYIILELFLKHILEKIDFKVKIKCYFTFKMTPLTGAEGIIVDSGIYYMTRVLLITHTISLSYLVYKARLIVGST